MAERCRMYEVWWLMWNIDCSTDNVGLHKDADNCQLFEIPVRFVVVELDAIGTAEMGQDLHDVFLLLGREFVFAMMVTIVGTHACALTTRPIIQACRRSLLEKFKNPFISHIIAGNAFVERGLVMWGMKKIPHISLTYLSRHPHAAFKGTTS